VKPCQKSSDTVNLERKNQKLRISLSAGRISASRPDFLGIMLAQNRKSYLCGKVSSQRG
jgi:hypothetical protein